MLDGGPGRAAARRPDRDQGRVAAALAGAALRRRRDVRPHRARRVRPLPRPARRRRDDRRGRQHARAGRQQHRQRLRLRARPQPLEHRALPRRLLERPCRRGRRAPRRRRGRRRRDRLDPLPGRLLRPDRPEADLRPLGDGRPPHGRRSRPRSSPARSAPTPPTAACSARSCSAKSLAAGDAGGLRIGVVRDSVSEDVAPAVREACEAAIEALRAETGGEVREIELADLEPAALATVLIANTEGLGGLDPERLNRLDPELSPIARGLVKYRMLLPAAASVKAQRVRTLMRHRLAAALRGRRRDRLADRAGGGAAAGGAAGRAALRHPHRRPGERARRAASPT